MTGNVDISRDLIPKISFKPAKTNPEVVDDLEEFKKRLEYFRYQQGSQ